MAFYLGRRSALTLLITFIIIKSAFSQATSTPKRDYINNHMIWNSVTIQGKIKQSNFYYMTDLEYRRQSDPQHTADPNTTIGKSRYNLFKNPYQFALRPWILYQPSQYVAVAISPICWFGTWTVPVDDVTFFQPELRSSFQLTLSNTIGRVIFNNRYRYELRYFGTRQIAETNDLFGPASSYSFPKSNRQGRARYMIRATLPLNTSKIETGTYYVMANTEILLRTGKNINNSNLLDQYRINLSLGWKFRDDIRIEIGYLNMIAFRFNNQAKNNVDVNNILLVKLIFDNFNNYLPSDD